MAVIEDVSRNWYQPLQGGRRNPNQLIHIHSTK